MKQLRPAPELLEPRAAIGRRSRGGHWRPRGKYDALEAGLPVSRAVLMLTLLAVITVSATPVRAGWREGSYMRVSLGMTAHDLGDLSNAANDYAAANNLNGGPFDYGLVTGFNLGFGAGALVTDRLTLGGRFAWHIGNLDSEGDRPRLELDYDVFDLVVDVSYAIPERTGVLVGARGGVSWGSVTRWTAPSGATGGSEREGEVSWDGSSGVVELFTGAQYYISDRAVPSVRVGYAFRDYGEVGEAGVGFDPVDLNFGGWFIEIGFEGYLRVNATPSYD